MKQSAPYPEDLWRLVGQVEYKAGWDFRLNDDLDRGQGSRGTLVITIDTPDSYHPETRRSVAHYFPVPPAAYDWRSWMRWLFDQVLLVERHEAMEFFQVIPAIMVYSPVEPITRPYAPSHGPGNDPYMIREVGTVEDVRTSFRGDLRGEKA